MVFGLEKRITKSPISQTKADLWGILKAVAPPDCPSMQGDVKSFCKQLEDNKNLKQKKYSKNAKDWYTKSFVFPQPPKEEVKSGGEPATRKQTDFSPSNLAKVTPRPKCGSCNVYL